MAAAVLDAEMRLPTIEEIDAEFARRRLRTFVEAAWPLVEPDTDFVSNWHIDAICEHLEAVTRGDIDRLLINVPPGTAKSLIVSVFWPAWEWATQPGLRYLTASYSDALTIRDNLKVRDIVQSSWYQRHFGDVTAFRPDQNQKVRMDTTEAGWRIATSVGGRGTGEHPDRIIIDDPHNAQQAQSDAERTSALDWFDRTISTRGVTRGARIVVIMQRLHQKDLSGHLLDKAPDRWVHLCLPMRYEPGRMQTTPLGWNDPRTAPGELLWPALFSEASVSKLETDLGSASAAGQLQQRPTPAGGGLFRREWFQVVDALPADAVWCRFWDAAGSEGKGDWTVGTLMAKTRQGVYYVAHVMRGRWSSGTVDSLMLQTAGSDRASHPGVAIREEQEPGSSGKAVVASHVRLLAGYDYRGIPATGPKETRWKPFAVQAEAGNVKVLRGPWNQAWFDELETVPFGEHDDQADSASGAFNDLARGGSLVAFV